MVIAPHLQKFLNLYPDISLDLECNDRFQELISDRLDLVVRVGTLTDSSYIAVPLAPVRLILVATPEYLNKHEAPRTPSDLNQHQCILFENHDQWTFKLNKQTQTINVNGALKSNTVTVMLSALQQHLGICLLPDILLKPLLQHGQVVPVLPQYCITLPHLPVEQLYALYPNRKHLPAKVRAFVDFFKEKVSRDVSG